MYEWDRAGESHDPRLAQMTMMKDYKVRLLCENDVA